MDNQKRKTFINNILNRKDLKDNIVVSSIQGLCHCAQKDDDQILYPLLDEDNKTIAGEALSALCNAFDQRKSLTNKMLGFIKTYPKNPINVDDELEFHAILELKILAECDKNILLRLYELVDKRSYLEDNLSSDNTVLLWKCLGDLVGERISGSDANELRYNPESDDAKRTKSKISEIVLKLCNY